MKIVAISNLHGQMPERIPACDLLLLAGDLAPVSNHALGFQRSWLDGPFRSGLRKGPARHIVGIAGNHDLIFEQAPDLVPRDLPWTYLQDSGTSCDGLSIWGTPWQPWFW